MRKSTFFYCLLVSAAGIIHSASGMDPVVKGNEEASAATSEMALEANPLTAKWTGPFGGIPPFDKIKVADFKPALEMAMNENLAEIEAIASTPGSPTFENTIAPLERSGKMLDRVQTIYGIWSSNMNNDEFSAVENEMEPKLAAFSEDRKSVV